MGAPIKHSQFACPDWWDRLQRGEVPFPDIPLNEEKATKALAFFNRLRLPDVMGNPPLSEACGQWFKDVVVAFLASEDPVTKARLVWELLCLVPKKSSKSTYSAALGLTALYLCEVPNGQMLLIGPSQNIAQRCFDQAQGMIRLDPTLTKIFKITDNVKSISRIKTGTELQVKTFDTGIVTGEIPLLTIIDELHVLGTMSKAQAVLQQIRGGGITMTGGQVLFITTQSDKRPAGVWKSELAKARAIRDGLGGDNPVMLPVLYEFPEALQKDEGFWRDPKNWWLVLPNLGLSISEDRLLQDYRNNGSVSAEAEQIWLSQHLNIEIGVGKFDDRWTGSDFWERQADASLDLETILALSEVVTIGIDPGGQDDLLSMSVIGRHAVTKRWMHWQRSWADRKVLKIRKVIAAQLQDFEKEGDLRLVDDLEAEGYGEMADICARIRSAKLLPSEKGIGIDSAGKAANMASDALEAQGFDASVDLVGVPQGYKLNRVSGHVSIKLDGGSFVHCGQSIMAWFVENCTMVANGNAEYPSKKDSGKAKIDGFMSMMNAAELMSYHPQAANTDISPMLARPVMIA